MYLLCRAARELRVMLIFRHRFVVNVPDVTCRCGVDIVLIRLAPLSYDKPLFENTS